MINIRHNFTCKQDFIAYLNHCTTVNATCYLLLSLSTDCMAMSDVDEDYEFYEGVYDTAKGLLRLNEDYDKETVVNALIGNIVNYEFR